MVLVENPGLGISRDLESFDRKINLLISGKNLEKYVV